MSGENRLRRRRFLKTAAATGTLATGLAAGAGVASASNGRDCVLFRVLGGEHNTDYRIEFSDYLEVSRGSDTESNDTTVDESTVEGTINDGYEDHYWTEFTPCPYGYIWRVEIDGTAAVQYCREYYCDGKRVYCAPSDPVQIDASGTGDYTFGWWSEGSMEAGGNVESGEIEGCYPTYSDTGDPQITCGFDPEGVRTAYVDPPDGEGYEADFGTGQLAGYTDSYHVTGAYYEGARYVFGRGDITVDIDYQ